jgi:hypothetical protein
LARSRAFSQHLLDGIAGHDVNHEKNESENEPERRKCKKKSIEEIARHV